jgi:hypothetical protein
MSDRFWELFWIYLAVLTMIVILMVAATTEAW